MIKTIEKRVSVRTYQKKPLLKNDEKAVKDIIEELTDKKGPFGHSVRLFFYDSPYTGDEVQIQIGTYGFVKNPPAFVAGCVKNDFEGIVDYGYLFEKVILRLTQMNLGSVWLGGTFNREAFDYLLAEGEVVPAVTPVGYPAENRSIKEKVIRTAIKGDRRLPFETLFFENDIKTPLNKAHQIAKYLELVRIGPSASNKQPWRVIVKGNKVHFYLEKTKGYAENMPFDIQALDLGIAICHFELGLIEDQKTYAIVVDSDHPQVDQMKYIISFDCIKDHDLN
ncbi:MAG: nitroreductase [Firmicutes bacterium]|nr:nitroreductase [Bacillota bacterium]